MSFTIRKILREALLFEHDTVEHRRVENSREQMRHVFIVNDVVYNVNFWHDAMEDILSEYFK